MKKCFLALVLVSACVSVHAQFGVGGQVNWSKYFQGAPSFIGLGVNVTYVLGETYPLRFSANFGLPSTEDGTTYANAYSSVTNPSQVQVTTEDKISLMNFWLDAQRYFGDGDYEDGGVYGLVGLGLTIASAKTEYGSYDANLYGINMSDESEKISQFGIRGALGYEAGLDFANVFGEAGLNLSANSANGQEIAINLPSFVFINAGVRKFF